MDYKAELEFIKNDLENEGLAGDQWLSWLENTEAVLLVLERATEKFEPYARSSISEISNVRNMVSGIASELEEVTE